ncbi:MAG: hypothetical protein L3K02_08195 [Thermoplasmata archaeon]|nr:hypothetical protein [Thermoplasmata archaeon]
MTGGERDLAPTALAAERHFVRTLGGLVLGIAGAELVTHERIPLSRFNFVEVLGVDRGRQAAFFERALDHYFQRALRPTFRVPIPEPDHVVAGLVGFGFRPQPHPLLLLIGARERVVVPPTDLEVRPATRAELEPVVDLLVGAVGRAEFRSAVDVAWNHPNPGERLTPVVATRGDRILSAALRYEHAGTTGLHFVTTQPADRGQGAASALVQGALGPGAGLGEGMAFLFADSARLEERLRSLGFVRALSFREYMLPADVELAFPPPGPPTPPRWRPPRGVAKGPAT